MEEASYSSAAKQTKEKDYGVVSSSSDGTESWVIELLVARWAASSK